MGCSDDHKEVDVMGSRMVDYSGRGPTLACVCKPDLVAPGSGIISCCNEPGKYFSKSGTSMSTPLVSGAIALLLEKYPDMSNKDVKLRIRERALDLGLPHNQQGWGSWMWDGCWSSVINGAQAPADRGANQSCRRSISKGTAPAVFAYVSMDRGGQ